MKNITVTNIESVNIADSRKKVQMLHDQVFDQWGIDVDKVYENSGLLKTIPPEWVPLIIEINLDKCKTPIIRKTINANDKTISIEFESEENCKKFYGSEKGTGEFFQNMNTSVNECIKAQGHNPQDYNRIIILESTADKLQVTLRY
jgi:hypothetical protein